MTRGLLEDELVRHKHQIELLSKELQERDEAGQRRIEKICKEHAHMLKTIESSIENHTRQILVIERQLANVHYVA